MRRRGGPRGAARLPAMSGQSLDGPRRWAPTSVAALFVGSGVLHLARPELYVPLIPPIVPARVGIIIVSGGAELACAAGLLAHARWAGWASALLLIAIFPANVAYAVQAASAPPTPPLVVAAAWGRLPLQAPLIWAALEARRRR